MGLSPGDRFSHAVWDIGAGALAASLSEILDAPLVLARFSRLVYDLNRPPEAPSAFPPLTETIVVPGNESIRPEDRAARVDAIYHPFHSLLGDALDGFAVPPVLVTIHSFTPTWHGAPRETEIGLLHDADPTLARSMLEANDTNWRVELNEPYSAKDGVTHTLQRHGTGRELPNVMIEVRNDLLSSEESTRDIADALTRMLLTALPKVASA